MGGLVRVKYKIGDSVKLTGYGNQLFTLVRIYSKGVCLVKDANNMCILAEL